ncbi:MAG: hypothetical protein IKT12_01905 [Thermoguttaceae bacterium]|nr:hypothetical protein [Thermoguttaceae bacterium]
MFFAYFTFSPLWLLIPLSVIFALVYAATRHEDLPLIGRHAGRVAFWTLVFLGVIFAALWLTS